MPDLAQSWNWPDLGMLDFWPRSPPVLGISGPDLDPFWPDMISSHGITFSIFVRRQETKDVGWKGLLSPFNLHLWMVVLMFILTMSCYILCTARFVFRWIPADENLKEYSIVSTLHNVFGAMLCSQEKREIDNNKHHEINIDMSTHMSAENAGQAYTQNNFGDPKRWRPEPWAFLQYKLFIRHKKSTYN
ncbi:unnamed protein product [Timema podura]|uniref:Uncharacterized protein n=1 Tax=Timema podura TaxID=61482 RepID=A0ABN7NG70_TIMPD|nr:unnamed protein product [Timema podura]